MWIEIRNLFDAISQVASFEDDKKSAEIISLIEKYKYRLSNVLSNNPKNAADKAKIVPGGKIKFDDVEITLDSSLCAESMIISDIFTLNELDSVDLILAGEAQKIHFDGINRGLIAVVCYYDAHRLLITTLRQILRWDREELPAKLVQLIDSTFIQANVVKHLFQLLNSFSVSTEFSRLMQPSVNGLGGSKHQKLLRNAIEEIRHEIITCISLICENPGGEALNIANYFFAIVKSVPLEKLNLTNMAAWLSLIKITSSEVLNQVPDATSVLNSMITHIRDETTWTDQSMCGTLQLACAVSLRALASSPADHSGIESIKVDVDLIVDRSIKNMVFQYLRHAIIRSDHFQFAHQFVVVDELLKQLVAFFPAKLMEIERNSSDELVFYDEKQKIDEKPKTGDVVATEKSAALSNYENFLRCFIDLYEMETEKTTKTAKERLLNQQIAESSSAFSTEKSMELCRLLERSRLPHHVVHAVAYLEFAAAVCKNHLTASFLYDIFARDYYGGSSDVVGWETLMTALRAYDRLFREQKNQLFSASRIQQQQQQQNKPAIDKTQIPAQELAGLIAWLRLSTKVALLDDIAAQRFSDDQSWGVLRSVASIASSSVPLPLKAALINFLTAVARLRGSAVRVWQVIHTNQLCYFAENGQLMGMQQELEERECAAKQYDVSLSFVRLVSTLISHKPLPEYSGAFIQFITRSILSQFASRSYNDIGQMWNLAEQSLKATNTLLEYGIVEPRSVANNEIHIALLSQCLNDTPLFRALARIIMEDCQAQTDPYTSKQTASSDSALIALRILSRAIVLHSALRACSRVSSSDIIVASIQALVFTPIHSSSPCTILDLVFQYLQMADDYPLHALYAARIFRDATATRGTVQGSMLELLRSRNSQSLHIRAIRTALCVSSIQYTINDSLEKEEETTNPIYARGETARIILETLSDSIDSSQKTARNEDSNNITYYLLAFRSSRGNSKELYDNDDLLTGLHYVLHIIEQFIATKSPFDLPFSALLEPAFRLMQRLVSMNCPFSKPVLCFMRSSNVIEKLVTSPFVCSALALEDEIDNTYATGVFSVRRMIAGYILHFAAVEIYAMLTTGHFTRPETLYRALLESSKLVSEYTMSEEEEEEGNDPNLLFSLLRRATIIKRFDLSYPELVHFDVNKLHELFDACLTITIYGVAQYDVAYLDKLLRREIDAVYKEGDDLKYVRKEMENVLEYCTEVNANLLSESASERIVNGCTALLNVFAAFAPVHFFSSNMQLTIFRDSCYVLIEMMSGIGGSSLVSAVQTFHRMVETVTKLAKDEYSKISDLRKFLAPLFKALIELLLQPGEKGVEAKVGLYRSVRLILRTVFEPNCAVEAVHEAEDWLLDGHETPSSSNSDQIVEVVDLMSDDISRHLASSISDLPKHRKSTAIILVNDLLHEDLKGSKKFAANLSRTGIARIICEELLAIDFDWAEIVGKNATAAGSRNAEHVANYNLLVAILTTLTRFSATESGWNAMTELAITEILSELIVFVEPPKEIFLKPENVKIKGTQSYLYANTVDLALHVCKQLCTKSKWKKLSLKVLVFIQTLGDVLQQLMRAEMNCAFLETASNIVKEIYVNDESINAAIDSENVLRQLRTFSSSSSSNSTNYSSSENHHKINTNSSFAAPRQLFSTLVPI